jgi:hypothetical protein
MQFDWQGNMDQTFAEPNVRWASKALPAAIVTHPLLRADYYAPMVSTTRNLARPLIIRS